MGFLFNLFYEPLKKSEIDTPLLKINQYLIQKSLNHIRQLQITYITENRKSHSVPVGYGPEWLFLIGINSTCRSENHRSHDF